MTGMDVEIMHIETMREHLGDDAASFFEKLRSERRELRRHLHEQSIAIDGLITERDAALSEAERLRHTLEFIAAAIDQNITGNDQENHRLLLEDGYHSGPAVDYLHRVLTAFRKLAQSALKIRKTT